MHKNGETFAISGRHSRWRARESMDTDIEAIRLSVATCLDLIVFVGSGLLAPLGPRNDDSNGCGALWMPITCRHCYRSVTQSVPCPDTLDAGPGGAPLGCRKSWELSGRRSKLGPVIRNSRDRPASYIDLSRETFPACRIYLHTSPDETMSARGSRRDRDHPGDGRGWSSRLRFLFFGGFGRWVAVEGRDSLCCLCRNG